MPEDPKTIYAYLIGVGQYPKRDHRLDAPKGDVKRLKSTLKKWARRSKSKIVWKVLVDNDATREKVIAGFDHFAQATENDICLFYYTGHGAQIPGNVFVDQNEGLIESLVLYDSREEDGMDLADKELAYLLSKNVGNNVPLIMIMDCCHAGANMRGRRRKKNIDDPREIRSIETFEGWENYEKKLIDGVEKYYVSPPPLIHLAACASHEKATEIYLQDKYVSIFTFSFCEALLSGRSAWSYADILDAVRLRVGQFVYDQTPQLETVGLSPTHKNKLFLNKATATSKYLVFMDDDVGAWKLNVGEMNDISIGDFIIFKKDRKKAKVESVELQSAIIEDVAFLDPTKVHTCQVIKNNSPALRACLAFPENFDQHQLWTDDFADKKGDHWTMVENESKATHLLRISEMSETQNYKMELIRLADNEVIWSMALHEHRVTSINTICHRLDQMSAFEKLLTISNPHSNINDSDIELDLRIRQMEDSGAFSMPTKYKFGQKAKCLQKQDGENALPPHLYLNITNQSMVPIFTSVQILSNGYDSGKKCSTVYSVTNRFMQMEMIAPGQTKGIFDHFEGQRYDDVPLRIMADAIAEYGSHSSFYIKVWIANEHFSTDRWNQNGYPFNGDIYFPDRSTKRSVSEYDPDWQTFTTEIIVTHEKSS